MTSNPSDNVFPERLIHHFYNIPVHRVWSCREIEIDLIFGSDVRSAVGSNRPAFWGLAALEWVVVLAVNVWILAVSAVMLRFDERT